MDTRLLKRYRRSERVRKKVVERLIAKYFKRYFLPFPTPEIAAQIIETPDWWRKKVRELYRLYS